MEWGFSVYFCFAEGKLYILASIVRTDFASAGILILRLYALYNQSKLVRYVLLGLFIPVVALSIGTDIFLYSRPDAFSGEFLLG